MWLHVHPCSLVARDNQSPRQPGQHGRQQPSPRRAEGRGLTAGPVSALQSHEARGSPDPLRHKAGVACRARQPQRRAPEGSELTEAAGCRRLQPRVRPAQLLSGRGSPQAGDPGPLRCGGFSYTSVCPGAGGAQHPYCTRPPATSPSRRRPLLTVQDTPQPTTSPRCTKPPPRASSCRCLTAHRAHRHASLLLGRCCVSGKGRTP